MNKPEGMKYLIDVACFIVIAVNLPFAVYGYLLFGSEVKGYVFENMPGTTFDNIVRLLLSIELTLTFPIVFKPATLVVEEWMETTYKIIRNKVSMSELPDTSSYVKFYHYFTLQYGMPSLMVKMYESSFMSYTIICIMRTFLVLTAWCVAILIPEFQLVVSFVGGMYH